MRAFDITLLRSQCTVAEIPALLLEENIVRPRLAHLHWWRVYKTGIDKIYKLIE